MLWEVRMPHFHLCARILPCSLDWPGTYYVTQTDLKLLTILLYQAQSMSPYLAWKRVLMGDFWGPELTWYLKNTWDSSWFVLAFYKKDKFCNVVVPPSLSIWHRLFSLKGYFRIFLLGSPMGVYLGGWRWSSHMILIIILNAISRQHCLLILY